MATYDALVKSVQDWSNRSSDVLSEANIKTFIQFSADNSYRHLRIAPLEYVLQYDPVSIPEDNTDTINKLAIPTDTIEFIQLRRKSNDQPYSDFTIYDAKIDIRSFYNDYLSKGSGYFYTRQRNSLIVYPDLVDGDEFELYYYRRLADPDARFTVSPSNDDSDLLHFSATSISALMSVVTAAEGSTVFTTDPDLESTIVQLVAADVAEDAAFEGMAIGFYVGKLAANWLRDQNEKVLLFGALKEAFDYLDEPDQSQKYAQKFVEEVEMLNMEDRKRTASGGNVQVHYESYLI